MKHKPIHNLKHWAHPPKAGVAPPSPKSPTMAGPAKAQVGKMKAPPVGKQVPPANVSKPRMRKA